MGSGGQGAGGVPASFDTLKFVIEQAPCFGAGCHNDEQNRLDLRVDDGLYGRLSSGTSPACGGIPILTPGSPQDSALLKILQGPCGATPRMPLGCIDDEDASCVPPEYLTALQEWIAAGAPPSRGVGPSAARATCGD